MRSAMRPAIESMATGRALPGNFSGLGAFAPRPGVAAETWNAKGIASREAPDSSPNFEHMK